jgi:hypothetical protein
MLDGALDFIHRLIAEATCAWAGVALAVEGADLEGEEDCFARKAAYFGRDAHISRIITRHVLAAGAHDDWTTKGRRLISSTDSTSSGR